MIKWHEVARTFAEAYYVRDMVAKNNPLSTGSTDLFEHLLFLFDIGMCCVSLVSTRKVAR